MITGGKRSCQANSIYCIVPYSRVLFPEGVKTLMFSKEGTSEIKTPRIVDVVWHNGEFIKWDDARVHVMSHVLHYGSSVFEGIRCYATKDGSAVFRLREHIQRLLNSAKIYRMDHPWD